MKQISYITIIIITLFAKSVFAEEEIVYEFEDAAPIKKQNVEHKPQNYGPMNVDQYEGDHSYWWYEKHDKKYRFYFGMSMPYNLGMDLDDVLLDTIDIPTDITDSNGNVVMAAGIQNINSNVDLSSGGGIGFTIKTGVEYNSFIRIDAELGNKQLYFDSIDLINQNTGGGTSTSYDISDDDVSLMYNYAGINLAVEYPRGIKAVSPFFGVSFGGGYFSTSGLGDDFTPYTQASLGFSYRFNDKVILEVSAASLLITDSFTFNLENTVDNLTVSGTTYENVDADVDIAATYDSDISGDLIINSIVIGYRFLF
ncbi:MAG: hypothetical protein ISQ32_05260 [Rickettsiales bacterium]|nr:hypothetical protein [Rickettsiales bacterium]